jgi:hypothetical protein
VHFTDGSALNLDGTWKHPPTSGGPHRITKAEREWLNSHDWWVIPEQNGIMNINLHLEGWLQSMDLLQPHEFGEKHIDTLSPEYGLRSAWISGAVKYLTDAVASGKLPSRGVLCAAFSLVGDNGYIGINYHACHELAQEFGRTPPSLYYFGESAIPWHNPAHPFKRVDLNDFPADTRQWALLHLEYLHENELEYRRSLWVVPRAASGLIGD